MVIGFTVGVWDVFHQGHVNVLKQCKEQCDYLHVGIMTDFWCHVQKGHDTLSQSLQKRMESLRECADVDNIVILDTLDMHLYLQMTDIWFKGTDQKNMRPFEFANSVILKRTPGISSTQIRATGVNK